MAFVLHLIDAADVADAEGAQSFVAQEYGKPPLRSDKFAAFVQEVTRKYPDLSEEDLDGDDDRNLWEEGIDSESTYGLVKELVVKVEVIDEAILADLIGAAAKCGLKLYDEEGEVLYGD
jgi:hypothetical protein